MCEIFADPVKMSQQMEVSVNSLNFFDLLITFFFLAQRYTAVYSPLLKHLLHCTATRNICVHLPVECIRAW